MIASKHVLRLATIFQYFLRLYLIYPLSSEITKANGVMMEKAWAGAAYNLTLYMLASHVSHPSKQCSFLNTSVFHSVFSVASGSFINILSISKRF